MALSPVLKTSLWFAVAIVVTIGATVAAAFYSGSLAVVTFFALAVLWGGYLSHGFNGWVGPHFFYDILRLARKPRNIGVRVLFVVILLFGLGYIFWDEFRYGDFWNLFFESGPAVSINALASLAERYVYTIIILQNLAVLIITPAYVAGAVAEERERRTLEMLFTSHLHNREIVFGKLMSRVFHMLGILLACLPVLSLSQLLGGVDVPMLLANFFNTVLNLITVGSVCILVSVMARSTFMAVITSYGVVLPFAACFGCFSLNKMSSLVALLPADFAGGGPMGSNSSLAITLLALLLLHGFVSGTCLGIAIASLRTAVDFDAQPTKPEDSFEYVDTSHLPAEARIVKATNKLHPLPPIEDSPLLWKEMYLGGRSIAVMPMFWAPVASFLIPLVLLLVFQHLDPVWPNKPWAERMENINPVFRFFAILFAGMFVIGVAYRASISLVRERQQQTLDALLTLPLPPLDILKAKWIGSLYKGWSWSLYFGAVLILALVNGGMHFLGVMLLVVGPIVHALFFASLGIWISVISRTVLIANMRVALVTLGLVAVGALGLFSFYQRSLFEDFLFFGLNPVANWYSLGFSYLEAGSVGEAKRAFQQRLLASLMGWAAYLIAAVVFWFLARDAFSREENRQGGFRA